MAKIVFFCIPAHGHTNPTLNVVRELIARGHQVWYYSYNILREKIEATGATFRSCDPYDMEMKLTAKQASRMGKDLALSTTVLVDTTLALGDVVCREMEVLQPDCIVADSMAIWGKAIAKKLNIPFVSSTTTFAFNQHSAKLMRQSPADLIRMLLSTPRINRQIRRLQSNGYPFHSVLEILKSDDNTHTIVYTSKEFQPYAETFSNKFAFVGPSVRPAVDTIVKTREKLLYISMGTVDNKMLPLYRRCIEAFRDADCQVILSVGHQLPLDSFGPLPEHISVHASVDQIAVLQQADAFISHCGMNSVSESLWFGVPLAMLPQTSEQWGVVNRVLELKAGILLQKTDTSSLRSSVNALLQTSVYRENAQKISAGFRAAPGAVGAVDKILSVCQK